MARYRVWRVWCDNTVGADSLVVVLETVKKLGLVDGFELAEMWGLVGQSGLAEMNGLAKTNEHAEIVGHRQVPEHLGPPGLAELVQQPASGSHELPKSV